MQKLLLTPEGLKTNVSKNSALTGAMSVANNLVIDEVNVAETRKGWETRITALSSGSLEITGLTTFGTDKLVATSDNGIVWFLSDPDSITWGQHASLTPISGDLVPDSAEAGDNLYIVSNRGVAKLLQTFTNAAGATLTSSLLAGTPPAGPLCSTGVGSVAATDWLPSNYQVAYRSVIRWTDPATGREYRSQPSGRDIIQNTAAGARTPFGSITFPVTMMSATLGLYAAELYRSAATPIGVAPSDEMQLVMEVAIPPATIDAAINNVAFTDVTPDGLRGAALYTNGSQEGIALQNSLPWRAKELALYQGSLFLGNVDSRHTLEMLLISTASGFLTSGDKVLVNGYVFTAAASENYTNRDFQIYTAGVVSENITNTVQSLVRLINRTHPTTRATYLSSDSDMPGSFQLWQPTFDSSIPFAVNLHTGAWSPTPATAQAVTSIVRTLGTTVTVTTPSPHGYAVGDQVQVARFFLEGTFPLGTKTVATVPTTTTFTYTESGINTSGTATYYVAKNTLVSASEVRVNRLTWSKPDQPEAFPPAFYTEVGPASLAIRKLVALQDCLLIFTDGGLYRLTGYSPETFQVTLVDATLLALAPESFKVLSGSCYGLSNQGVVRIDSSGQQVQVISLEIENLLREITDNRSEEVRATGLGWVSERERKYYLQLEDADGNITTFVYGLIAGNWLTWDRPLGAFVQWQGQLFGSLGAQLLRERNTGTNSDYFDEEGSGGTSPIMSGGLPGTVSSITVGVLLPNMVPGNIVYCRGSTPPYPSLTASSEWAEIASVNVGTKVITFTEPRPMSPGVVSAVAPITVDVTWREQSCDAPALLKHFRELHVMLGGPVDGLSLGASVDDETSLNMQTAGTSTRIILPLQQRRGTWLTVGLSHTDVFNGPIKVEGSAITYNSGSGRVTR